MFNSAVDSVIVISETWRVISKGCNPSSIGSYASVMVVELMAVSWCNPGILFFIISEMDTVLLIACPIAFKTISLDFLS